MSPMHKKKCSNIDEEYSSDEETKRTIKDTERSETVKGNDNHTSFYSGA